MSAEAVGWVFRHSPYSGLKFAVHLAIADSVNDQHDQELWMSQSRLASKARCSRPRANEALVELVDDGYLVLLEEHVGRANRYRFVFPDVPVSYESRPRKATLNTGGPVPSRNTPPNDQVSPGGTPPVPSRNTHLFRGGTPPVPSRNTEPKKPKAGTQPPPPARRSQLLDDLAAIGREEAEEHLTQIRRRLHGDLPGRLDCDPAADDLLDALVEIAARGWTPPQAAVALTADPLGDARSIARVLAARARHLADLDPPQHRSTAAAQDCRTCAGSGWIAATDERAVVACPCKAAA
jgi:hypothetical protein